MPLIERKGAASSQGFGEFARTGGVATYIEDVFSTYLYTGNGSTQTITNGIDLSTYGGLVWTKCRDTAYSHALTDTARGGGNGIYSNTTQAQGTSDVSSFTTSGFGLTFTDNTGNRNTFPYVSWTFRKQPKFFDVVTYTGTGSLRTVAHNLGSVPGCILIKNLSDTDGWLVYHRSIGATETLTLNTTGAAVTNGSDYFNNTEPTSTVFTVNIGGKANQSGNNYVAYLFAHDAGGFGLTGTDNVISCGSFSGTAGNTLQTVTLGYEPQWLLVKATSTANNWIIVDNMRGFTADGVDNRLMPNLSDAEVSASNLPRPVATGFQHNYGAADFIYIAIRRGPMKTPTTGTSVFSVNTATVGGSPNTVTTNFPVDLDISTPNTSVQSKIVWDRLRGSSQTTSKWLETNNTNQESSTGYGLGFDSNTGFADNFWGPNYGYTSSVVYWNFRRAPGFFDVVCWSSTGTAQTLNHNLGVVPELMIRKVRNGTWESWMVYAAAIGNTKILYLDQTAAQDTNNGWNNQTPTSTQFFVNNTLSGYNMVTYLFATVAGVSKVGSYTGTGTTKQIDCGFTGGSRFVLIKRTDSTGDWYVWDSARGIVSGNDPYLLLNDTAAEVTNTDYVDTYSAGFEISSTAPAAINANGGSFIFLAIA